MAVAHQSAACHTQDSNDGLSVTAQQVSQVVSRPGRGSRYRRTQRAANATSEFCDHSDATLGSGTGMIGSEQLVCRRFLHVLDHDDINRTNSRLQLQPELLLHRREDGGRKIVRC